MMPGTNGLPDPAKIQTFDRRRGAGRSTSRSGPTATCTTSTSTAARSAASATPRATGRRSPVLAATPTTGVAPLTVSFDARAVDAIPTGTR